MIIFQDTGELFFDDVRLPSSALLSGEEGLHKGFYRLMNQLPRERLMLGLCSQAMAETVFETTRDYVRQRKAFGKTLSKLQVGVKLFLRIGFVNKRKCQQVP